MQSQHCIVGSTAGLCYSFVCDELDGRFARLLHQTSTLGIVLDMVTDRCAKIPHQALASQTSVD